MSNFDSIQCYISSFPPVVRTATVSASIVMRYSVECGKSTITIAPISSLLIKNAVNSYILLRYYLGLHATCQNIVGSEMQDCVWIVQNPAK